MTSTRDHLVALLRELAERGASELHLKVPNPPTLRVAGGFLPLGNANLAPSDTAALLEHLASMGNLPSPAGTKSLEFSFGVHGIGRFHAFAYRQRGSVAVVVRRMETAVPTLAAVGLGDDAHVVPPGLSLLIGPSRVRGMHAILGAWNARRPGILLVLESPVSCLHRDARAAVSQRDVGVEVADVAGIGGMAAGIRDGLRMGADLVAVAGIPDRAAADAALTAAEHGAAVLACIAAPEPGLAPWWVARLFEGTAREDAERRLDHVLVQVLVPGEPRPERGAP
jgi:Tfp pilus assembly ATPase PilU